MPMIAEVSLLRFFPREGSFAPTKMNRDSEKSGTVFPSSS